jgi:hypothetical protein
MEHSGVHIDVEIALGQKVVRKRRSELALLKRKPIVLEELEELPAGKCDLGEINDETE